MSIAIQESKPVKPRPYSLPYVHEEFVTTEIRTLIQKGIIEKSTAPWRSPAVVVAKKDGKLRLCVNYREVNKLIKDNAYMLPRNEEILEAQWRNHWFSSLDFFSVKHQLPLEKASKDCTTFVFKHQGTWELYRYNVLYFGFKVPTNNERSFPRGIRKNFAYLFRRHEHRYKLQ